MRTNRQLLGDQSPGAVKRRRGADESVSPSWPDPTLNQAPGNIQHSGVVINEWPGTPSYRVCEGHRFTAVLSAPASPCRFSCRQDQLVLYMYMGLCKRDIML